MIDSSSWTIGTAKFLTNVGLVCLWRNVFVGKRNHVEEELNTVNRYDTTYSDTKTFKGMDALILGFNFSPVQF